MQRCWPPIPAACLKSVLIRPGSAAANHSGAGYVIYAFKEGSIRVINQSAKDTAVIASLKKPIGIETLEDHFKLSNASKAIRTFSFEHPIVAK